MERLEIIVLFALGVLKGSGYMPKSQQHFRQEQVSTKTMVGVEYITKNSARRATFGRRKTNLLSKARELDTLCGLEVCAIVQGPYNPEPDFWPSQPAANDVLRRYMNVPEAVRKKNKQNMEEYLMENIRKLSNKLKEEQLKNREYEMTDLMFQGLAHNQVPELGIGDLRDFAWVVDDKMNEVQQQIEFLLMTTPHMVAENEGMVAEDGGMHQFAILGGSDGENLVDIETQARLLESFDFPGESQQFGYHDLVMPNQGTNTFLPNQSPAFLAIQDTVAATFQSDQDPTIFLSDHHP